jgi:hypothetical protein
MPYHAAYDARELVSLWEDVSGPGRRLTLPHAIAEEMSLGSRSQTCCPAP